MAIVAIVSGLGAGILSGLIGLGEAVAIEPGTRKYAIKCPARSTGQSPEPTA